TGSSLSMSYTGSRTCSPEAFQSSAPAGAQASLIEPSVHAENCCLDAKQGKAPALGNRPRRASDKRRTQPWGCVHLLSLLSLIRDRHPRAVPTEPAAGGA